MMAGGSGTLAPVEVAVADEVEAGGSLVALMPAPSADGGMDLCLSIRAFKDGMEPRYASRAPMMVAGSRPGVPVAEVEVLFAPVGCVVEVVVVVPVVMEVVAIAGIARN